MNLVPDWLSDGAMLTLVLTTIAIFSFYAWRFRHIWLGACIVPLLWFAYYYFLQFLGHDYESFSVMLLFRPTLAMLFIFLSAFIARDRVDNFIVTCALRVAHGLGRINQILRKVESIWNRR
jgi:vacuolar-type H+-ATPase subunit I/STV1